mgnify:CR=1 FL=1
MKFKEPKTIKPLSEVKEHKRFRKAVLAFKVSFWFALTTLAVYGAVAFYNSHTFRSPIIFQNPIPLKVNKIISPVASPSAKTTMIPVAYAQEVETPQIEASSNEIDYNQVAYRIFGLESTWGKNDGCKTKGLGFNGYGYRQNSFEWVCYPTQEEVRQHVINRIKELTVDMDLETALCYYNTGYKVKGCNYYKNYLSIN